MSNYKCPRDNSPLVVENIITYVCPECGGTLLDLTQSKSKLFLLIPSLLEYTKDCELICPISGKRMKEAIISGITIDYCEEANTIWFDAGEFEKVKAHAAKELSSTLDKSKNKEDHTLAGVLDFFTDLLTPFI